MSGLDFRLKRAYEAPEASDGARFLVERLWPRGVPKERLQLTAWLKDVAPSPDLRRWYGHQIARWDEFQRRYCAELAANEAAWAPLLAAARQGPVTLVYAARDTQHNSACVLKQFLEER